MTTPETDLSWLEELFDNEPELEDTEPETEPEPDPGELSRMVRGEVREGYGKPDSGANYLRRLFAD